MSGPTIRYRNGSGAQVGVFEGQPKPGHPVLTYRAGCTGCLVTFGSAEDPESLNSARSWAIKHAAECRALPQPDESAPDFRALAAEFADRAVKLLGGMGSQFELSDRTGNAMAYVAVADIYARLAES